MNIFLEINNTIGINLNNFVIENQVERYVGIFADGPIFFLPLFLVSYWIYYTYIHKNDGKKSTLLNIFYSTIVAVTINLLIQQVFHFDRPESIVQPLIEHIPDNSFPSDHAAVSFAFLFAILFSNYKKTFLIFFPFVILMNLSRIAGGIHWFFDVLTGMLIGILSALLIMNILREKKSLKNLNKKIIKELNKINF